MKLSLTFTHSCQTTLQDISLEDIRSKAMEMPLIIDASVAELYPQFTKGKEASTYLLLLAGEGNKNYRQVHKVYRFLDSIGCSRNSEVMVIGGGTISDLAGFALSTYKRGLRICMVPSTLIGMVDAAIGGKTGYNRSGIKNQIGSFAPAESVMLCPELLNTLPHNEIRQGWAELLKMYLIDLSFPDLTFPLPSLPPQDLIFAAALAKLRYCRDDLWDRGMRRHLNLGHSFGHAIESYSKGRIAHGDAVFMGMHLALEHSYRFGLIKSEIRAKILALLKQYPLPEELWDYFHALKFNKLMPYLRLDKKNSELLRLILFDGFRSVKVCQVDQNGCYVP